MQVRLTLPGVHMWTQLPCITNYKKVDHNTFHTDHILLPEVTARILYVHHQSSAFHFLVSTNPSCRTTTLLKHTITSLPSLALLSRTSLSPTQYLSPLQSPPSLCSHRLSLPRSLSVFLPQFLPVCRADDLSKACSLPQVALADPTHAATPTCQSFCQPSSEMLAR